MTYRALAYISNGECRLVSRKGHRFKRFDELAGALAKAIRVRDAIIDGEIVCLDFDGRSLFYELLYKRGQPVFYAFDLPWLNGKDLRRVSLIERKKLLRRLIGRRKHSPILYAERVEATGKAFFNLICERNLEGMVAKHRAGLYTASTQWIKIKNPNYTQAEGRRELFEAFRKHSQA
jgi:bifunctional non-homologous end joining protein LigD